MRFYKVKLVSTITCSICKHQKEKEMPTDACDFFWVRYKSWGKVIPFACKCKIINLTLQQIYITTISLWRNCGYEDVAKVHHQYRYFMSKK